MDVLVRWTTADLKQGDLTLLSDLSRGIGYPEPDRVERLSNRRFIADDRRPLPKVTLKGRIALLVRRGLRH